MQYFLVQACSLVLKYPMKHVLHFLEPRKGSRIDLFWARSGIYFVNFDLSVFTVICPGGLNWPGVLAGIFLLNWLQWMMFTIFSGTRVCCKDYENHCSLEFIHGVFLMKKEVIYKIAIKLCVRNLIQGFSVKKDKT